MEFGNKNVTLAKPATEEKPVCKYGEKCYRKHPSHLQEYSHPWSESENVVSASKKTASQKVATGKITDYFGSQSSSKESYSQKKKAHQALQVFDEDSDFSIEDPFEVDNKNVNKARNKYGSPQKKRRTDVELKKEVASTSHFKADDPEKENSQLKKRSEKQDIETKKQFCHSKDDLTEKEINRINTLIEKLFLVKMPSDFFHFWNFCLLIKRSNPKDAIVNWVDLTLVGPFDVLINNISENDINHLSNESKEELLCHWRYYFDVPEFQTVLKGGDDVGFHIGYFRDNPKQCPVFVASNESLKSCTISPMGDNLFIALQDVLRKKIKSNGTNAGLEALQRRLTEFCKKKNIPLSNTHMIERNKSIVAKPFHGAGLVVPFKNDVGYRDLPLSNGLYSVKGCHHHFPCVLIANLKKLFKRIIDCTIDREKSRAFEELQEIFTLINYANDELDFGMGLELGIDLFCCGEEYFHSRIQFLLETAYNLLENEEFSQIITAHLKRRTKVVSNLNKFNALIK